MSATPGYAAACQAVVGAYAEAEAEYLKVIQSSEYTPDIGSAYGRLTMTRTQFHAYQTEFTGYERHSRSVNACLTAIQTLNSTQANSAKGALHTLRAAMQRAFFKMFDYDDNELIDRNEMTRFLSHRFSRVYRADPDMEQQMGGATYQVLAEVTTEQAFEEAHPNVDDSMSLEEFNEWYATSDKDGAAVFLRAGGNFNNVPLWLEHRLEVLNAPVESMELGFRW